MNDLQEQLDRSESRNRLNNLVAVSVALISVFMAVTKVKDDNIVQTMLQAKSDAVDTWNEYQSKKIKQHLAEIGLNQARVLLAIPQSKDGGELSLQQKNYQESIARYQKEAVGLSVKAKELEKRYDDLNFRDDQFDLSDAVLSISMAMLAITSLTSNRSLFAVALFFAFFGIIMGIAGLFGLPLHPSALIQMLS
ncbi:MAG: DUF4337 domain-containing protein [Chlorobium sp.]|nr:MAG: DUF4337 domain-containing protein [Chlorobium sp.]